MELDYQTDTELMARIVLRRLKSDAYLTERRFEAFDMEEDNPEAYGKIKQHIQAMEEIVETLSTWSANKPATVKLVHGEDVESFRTDYRGSTGSTW